MDETVIAIDDLVIEGESAAGALAGGLSPALPPYVGAAIEDAIAAAVRQAHQQPGRQQPDGPMIGSQYCSRCAQ